MANTNDVMVQRANVILSVSEDQLDYYMNQGYNLIDEQGNIIKSSVPRDLGMLQKAYIDHKAEIERLKAEIVKLQKQRKSKNSEKK